MTLLAGDELLGSDDGVAGFRTPLATAHAFQGWADKFLVTPAEGVEDVTVGLKAKFGKGNGMIVYHQLASDFGGIDFGDEINLIVNYPATENLSLQFKFADYSADARATDTSKVWLSAMLKF